MDSWSGESDWTQEEYLITPGNHTFQWTFDKDGNVSGGDDCVWIDFISFPCTSAISSTPQILQPSIVTLEGNHPNPFNPSTTISFTISCNEEVKTTLEIFNVKGQLVKTLVDRELQSGLHSIIWNGENNCGKPVTSGIYFSIVDAYHEGLDYTSIKKVILLK